MPSFFPRGDSIESRCDSGGEAYGLNLCFSNLSCIRITWKLVTTQLPQPLPRVSDGGSLGLEQQVRLLLLLVGPYWENQWFSFTWQVFLSTLSFEAHICKSRKLHNSLLQTIPTSLCLKVYLVIQYELPKVYITFLSADSKSDLMFILHCVSSFVNWLQCQQDRT